MLKGLFQDHIQRLRNGIEANMAELGELGRQPNLKEGAKGAFFDDYCSWHRISEFEDVVRNSPAAEVAADLMQSETVQVFHDHVLVKEPGTAAATPWHRDGPYYFVEGEQTISFWSPLGAGKDAALRLVPCSHLWEKPVLSQRWHSKRDFFPGEDIYMPIPDPDVEGMPVVEWEMEPGDAVAFSYLALHGTRGETPKARRRAMRCSGCRMKLITTYRIVYEGGSAVATQGNRYGEGGDWVREVE